MNRSFQIPGDTKSLICTNPYHQLFQYEANSIIQQDQPLSFIVWSGFGNSFPSYHTQLTSFNYNVWRFNSFTLKTWLSSFSLMPLNFKLTCSFHLSTCMRDKMSNLIHDKQLDVCLYCSPSYLHPTKWHELKKKRKKMRHQFRFQKLFTERNGDSKTSTFFS